MYKFLKSINDIIVAYIASSYFGALIFFAYIILSDPSRFDNFLAVPSFFLLVIFASCLGPVFGWLVAFPSILIGIPVAYYLSHIKNKNILVWLMCGILIGLANLLIFFKIDIDVDEVIEPSAKDNKSSVKYLYASKYEAYDESEEVTG